MTQWIASLSLFAVAGIASVAIGSLVGAVVVTALRRRIAACEPEKRHRALLVLAAAPLLVAAALTISASLPAILALAIPGLDHCTAHDDGHAHLCFRHPPAGISPAISLVLVLFALHCARRLVRAAMRTHRTRRVLESLVASGQRDATLGITIVESTLPICMVAGLARPRVLIARALLERLSAGERNIVLTHERTHLERRDALTAIVARMLCAFHIPSIRRLLLAELAIAAEQACDDAAAIRVGDRVAVAATILAVHRAWGSHGTAAFGAAGLGFAMHALERRIESLLAEPVRGPSFAVHRWCAVAVAVLTLSASSVLHHWTESVVSHVAL